MTDKDYTPELSTDFLELPKSGDGPKFYEGGTPMDLCSPVFECFANRFYWESLEQEPLKDRKGNALRWRQARIKTIKHLTEIHHPSMFPGEGIRILWNSGTSAILYEGDCCPFCGSPTCRHGDDTAERTLASEKAHPELFPHFDKWEVVTNVGEVL